MSNSSTAFSSKDIKEIFDGHAVKPGAKSSGSETNAESQTQDSLTRQTEMMAQSDMLG